jgi:3-hydroxyisobutyrate dehydrogenase
MARIAFLGLGRMGTGMAGRLLTQGHDLALYNRTPAKARALVERGARLCASPREACKGADAIVAMVSDDVASRAVWLGPDGALAGHLKAGALTIECSTLSHAWSVGLAGLSAALGYRHIDAPVTGLPDSAAEGTLTLLVGAAKDDLEDARGLLDRLALRVIHFGPAGAGTAYKLIVNLIGAIQIASAAEGLAVAERAGLDPVQVAQALISGQAASPQVIRNVGRMLGGPDVGEATFTAALRLKDVSYANELLRTLDSPSPVGLSVERLFRELCDGGYADSSESTVYELLRSR